MYNQFVNYFKELVSNHPQFAGMSEKIFEVISIDEALGDFRSAGAPKGFIFRLIDYTSVINGNSDLAERQIQAGFIIAKHHSNRKNGANGQAHSLSKSESILFDFVKQMMKDSEEGNSLFNYSLNNDIRITAKKNTGDIGYSGWLCTFTFTNQFDDCNNG